MGGVVSARKAQYFEPKYESKPSARVAPGRTGSDIFPWPDGSRSVCSNRTVPTFHKEPSKKQHRQQKEASTTTR